MRRLRILRALKASTDISVLDPEVLVCQQDFAWTEETLPQRIAERNALIEDPAHHGAPMFCFATTIRLFCWACCAYGYSKEHQDHESGVAMMSIETAVHIWPNMEHYEVQQLYHPQFLYSSAVL